MIIRQFLAWTQHTSAARRAEAAGSLARAYLYGGLGEDVAWEAEAALLALLDDPSSLVRRALAEACAACANAPRPLIVALAGDQAEIATLVLARSPVLSDADLVDGVAIGCAAARRAIASRIDLSPAVAGALAEIAEAEALVVLARNRNAHITTGSLMRMVERHGDVAALREAVLARPYLPLEVRQSVTTRLAESLSAFAVSSGWLTPARSARASREAQERTTLAFCAEAHPVDLARLVAHLKADGQLNAGLLLRAILSGNMAFAETALADLAGLPVRRVAGLMHDASSGAFAALHRKAGLPPVLLPAFSAALSAWREAGQGAITSAGAGLSRLMIERALTACETMPFAEAQSVMALLSRFEAEAARDEARVLAREMAAEAERSEILRIEREILDGEWREAQRQVLADWDVPQAVETAPDRAAPDGGAEKADEIADENPTVAAVSAPEDLPTTEHLPTVTDLSVPEAPVEADAVAVAESLAAVPAEAPAEAEATRTDPVGLILDGLSDALLAEFEGSRARNRALATEVVLDAIPEALIASYREDRARLAA
ncbi:hypothetical protein ASF49_17955 [Methylobacterium sp. Leaf104]|uniref:DUF2336 domain-containing protein n=1 Tax=Methylobacterium TaxID=407 RepID=UPI000701C02D|nr:MULTISPECIES: DUF2336 domain-containing protein [Methylobacterium]KQP41251.1 hypothetical protein ASF49_17955 [Methylobacterium sp. Leaf104]MCI9879356.1 DUF2336 domain-containing protein [Methylobacterium goesingense]